jgi:type IV pilus assembly protein PilN
MARINLLPWREAERKRRQRNFAILAASSLVATALLGVGIHWQIERLISIQEGRNQFLQTQISMLDRQIAEIRQLEKTKANLLARMNVIERLQQSRPEVVHLFDEVVKAIPEGIFLTKLSQSGRSVVVEGQAQSNARVSAFMRNIEASAWIGNPRLLLIEQKGKAASGLSRFQLRFDQKERATADNALPAHNKGKGRHKRGRSSARSTASAQDARGGGSGLPFGAARQPDQQS